MAAVVEVAEACAQMRRLLPIDSNLSPLYPGTRAMVCDMRPRMGKRGSRQCTAHRIFPDFFFSLRIGGSASHSTLSVFVSRDRIIFVLEELQCGFKSKQYSIGSQRNGTAARRLREMVQNVTEPRYELLRIMIFL